MSPSKPSKLAVAKRSHFAQSDEEAERRYQDYKSVDPFPSIPPSYLNSADFSDYVSRTGLIYPFCDDDDNFKPASYRLRILGDCVYWDDDDRKQTFFLQDGEDFVLPRNSITFITFGPVFRLPDYIKITYQLDASHGFKGLLLNPGFIDPGYVGRLKVPLHNPTANDYILRAHDSLIWVDFIKISPLPQWRNKIVSFPRRGKFFSFPERKLLRKTVHDDLDRAVGREGSVRNAIPVVFKTIAENAQAAVESAEKAAAVVQEEKTSRDQFWKRVKMGTLIALLLGLLTLIIEFASFLYQQRRAQHVSPQPSADVLQGQEKNGGVNPERSVSDRDSPSNAAAK